MKLNCYNCNKEFEQLSPNSGFRLVYEHDMKYFCCKECKDEFSKSQKNQEYLRSIGL